jgi:hypothetical protein
MSDAAPLRPATADEIAETRSFALRFDGRRRVHHADDAMTRITVERLVTHLERSGFVDEAPAGTITFDLGDAAERRLTSPPIRPSPQTTHCGVIIVRAFRSKVSNETEIGTYADSHHPRSHVRPQFRGAP